MPASVAIAAAVLILFLALFALEVSDSWVADGSLARSAFFFPPTVVLFCGLLTRRLWAWWSIRVLTLLGTMWFAFWVVVSAVGWFGGEAMLRVWIGGVSLWLGGSLVVCFQMLGRPAARGYFNRS